MQISPNDRAIAEQIIRSEFFNYLPLKHEKNMLDIIWQLSEHITKQEIIKFSYTRQDSKKSKKTIKPAICRFKCCCHIIGIINSPCYFKRNFNAHQRRRNRA